MTSQRGPRGMMTWFAIGAFAIGLLLTGFFAWRIVETAPRQPADLNDGPVELKRDGLTIYASLPLEGSTCFARDENDADIALKRPAGTESITLNGTTWYVVARSVEKVPPQTVVVSCPGDYDLDLTYGVGPRSGVLAFTLSILGTVFSGVGFVVLGVLLLTIDRRRRRPSTTFNTFRGGNTFPAPPQDQRPQDT
ncbi:hypothetical protein [Kribbella sp. DT2]|uniref:hypothetical protein n=1 Tax=Kribbella sp. DT2 TaxID=3393427 RepID=UPI003CFA2393